MKRLGWFRTTFAMAGKTCHEIVERVGTRAVLTEKERKEFRFEHEFRFERCESRFEPGLTPLAVAVVDGDVEALEWLTQRFYDWRNAGRELLLGAKHGKIEILECLRQQNVRGTSGRARRRHVRPPGGAAVGDNECPWNEWTCTEAAFGGHLGVLQWARENGCP